MGWHKASINSWYINWTLHVLFESNRLLSQEEIIGKVYEQYKKKWSEKKLTYNLSKAVRKRILLRMISGNRVTYYPVISKEELTELEEKQIQKLFSSPFSCTIRELSVEDLPKADWEEIREMIRHGGREEERENRNSDRKVKSLSSKMCK